MSDLPIYTAVQADLARYHQPDAASTTTPEDPVSLAQDIQNDITELRTKIGDVVTKVETIATDRLPQVVEKIDTAETNPVVQAVEAAVHIPPSYLASVAKSLLDLEDFLAAKEAENGDTQDTATLPPAGTVDTGSDQAPQPNMQAGAEAPTAP